MPLPSLLSRLARWLRLSASAAGLGLAAAAAVAQQVPATMKVLVGYPAGAGTDLMARAFAEGLAKELKNTVIVENRPGAGGQIAARLLKDAPPDGSTLLLAIDHQIVMIPHTMKAPGYKPFEDFQPVIQLATYDICAGVSGKSPARNVAEWVRLAKQDSTQRSVGIPAAGSNAQFLAHALSRHFGIALDVIPYKGGAPLINDVSGGHVSAFVLPCGDPIVTAHESGRARILLTSADQGHPRVPQASSFKAEGIAVPSSAGYFMAVYSPARTPVKVLEALRKASAAVARQPDMPDRIAATGMVPLTVAPQQLQANAERSAAAWGALIRESGFQPE